jgi:hypothetical protein
MHNFPLESLMAVRDADEVMKLYGADALSDLGEVVSRPDGVRTLAAVVDAIATIEEDAPSAQRTKPLVDLYQDPPRFRAVMLSSIDRGAEIEAELMRLAGVLTTRMSDQLRTRLAQARRDDVKKALRLVGEGEELEVRAAVDWPEYPAGVVVPAPWHLGPTQLSRTKNTPQGTASEAVGLPVLITRKLRDADDETYSVELAWWNGRRWQTAIVPRSTALDSRALVRLADQGLPVSSATSRRVVEWLTCLDQQPGMPSDWSAARCGWVGETARFYLLGKTCIYEGEEPAHRVSFATQSAGADQFADAVRPEGTWEGWQVALDIISDQPAPWVAIYAAVAAPLLRILGAPNFGIDFAGQSGSGKSTVLELAASTLGKPAKGAVMAGWDGSLAGTESGVGVRCDMVTCLDEGQLVAPSRHQEAGALLYAIISGAGRAKGALGRLGMSHVDSWRTVLLSTSEEGITAWSPHDGVRRRILELRHVGVRTAEDSTNIRAVLSEHYGHLYPRAVQALVDMTDERRLELRDWYRARRAELWKGLGNSVVRSLADYMAVIDTAAQIVHGFCEVKEPKCDVPAWLWQQIQLVGGADDRARRAAEYAESWAWAQAHRFVGRSARGPSQSWLGVWEKDGEIAFIPELLFAELTARGFGTPDSIIREWAQRGWIKTEKGRHRILVPRPTDGQPALKRGRRMRMIVLLTDEVGAGT